jgi:hypothetical protein
MANVKTIGIVADVPFDCLDRLGPDDAAMLARWLLSLTVNLAYTYAPAGFEPSQHGGETAIYRLEITGGRPSPTPAWTTWSTSSGRSVASSRPAWRRLRHEDHTP